MIRTSGARQNGAIAGCTERNGTTVWRPILRIVIFLGNTVGLLKGFDHVMA
jgi:hypothetical protein